MTAKLDHEVADLKQRLYEALAERDEAEARQAAMAEIVEAINASSGQLAPVFDILLQRAMRLCEAAFGILQTYDGRHTRTVATRGVPAALAAFRKDELLGFASGTGPARILAGEHFVHFEDMKADDAYRNGDAYRRALVDLGGARTGLNIGLIRENVVLGFLILYRQEVRPFSDNQLSLLQSFAAQAVIAIENARLLGELHRHTDDLQESLEYQTATSDVLKVISRSTFDLQPVLKTVVETAARLCEADMGFLLRREGDLYRAGAATGFSPEYEEFMRTHPIAIDRGSATGRVALERRTVHIEDVAADPEYTLSESTTLAGQRTALGVPLLREEQPIGVIVLARRRVEPFTHKQIELVTTFADQAVIAIENTRLITETHEALEQQTATAEVLGVINSSPGDLAPVFDAMLEKAMRLCEAEFGLLRTFDGEAFHAAASRGVPTVFAEFWRVPRRPSPGLPLYRLICGENLVHIPDVTADDIYRSGDPIRRAFADEGGARTGVWVALRKDASLLGAFIIYRKEVRPFSDKQIALLQNFAAQAVIAMENARLITETREALEQQTATAEVLGVINSSPGDLAPVFDAMLEKATRLCDAAFGFLWTWDGEQMHRQAFRGVPDALLEEFREPLKPPPGSIPERIVNGERVVSDLDVLKGPRRSPILARLGARSCVGVALRKDNKLLGGITIYRGEVRLFAEKQLALLQNFAAQAVIAMENARLINETREALDQQTATAEVLGVINSSPGDLAPVFDAMLEKAMRLCGAALGMLGTYDGERFHIAALRGVPAVYEDFMRRNPPSYGAGTGPARLLAGERVVHIHDMATEAPYLIGEPNRRALVDLGGARTGLILPLLKDDAVRGFFMIYRQEVRPFTDKQVALLQNFAAQAVIAMENARLITETRVALEQQTATAEVLQVINSSPGDLGPVFDAILERAHNLCGIDFGSLQLHDSGKFRAVAVRGVAEPLAKLLRQPFEPLPESPPSRLLLGERVVQILDIAASAKQRPDDPRAQATAAHGLRTVLFVPLRRDADLLGYIGAFRKEVRPFSDKQVTLLENFAAQAVIAIENARLITETRESLEQQTAMADVLQVINASPGDLAPVFDAILEKAHSLCAVEYGSLQLYDGEKFRAVATWGYPDRFDELLRQPYALEEDNSLRAVLEQKAPFEIPDVAATEAAASNPRSQATLALGVRGMLFVPLVKDNALLGLISAGRAMVGRFTDTQITLLQNFAAQAVIAIENARLINETREALEQQTATAEVLGVINSSPGDLGPVFDSILEKAHTLCGAEFGSLQIYDGQQVQAVASRGLPDAFVDQLRQGFRPEADHPIQELLRGARIIQLDMAELDNSIGRAAFKLGGMRIVLFVPLRKDGLLLGYITAARPHLRAFSEKEIALLENFAAQAVIAIENARLITETREALEQQTATAEVLSVINASPGDLAPVFDAMLQKAMHLCDAAFGILWMFDQDRLIPTAMRGVPEDFASHQFDTPPGPGTAGYRFLSGERSVIQNMDLAGEESGASDPLRRSLVDLAGARSALHAPLCKDNAMLGIITIYRQEVRPFTEKQVALLQNFAAQAVIAIENARLLNEIRQRQAELRVTFDNMADGVAMFDEDLRLAAWNRNFQQIADLPEALLAERPSYPDYLRILTERGELDIRSIDAELSRRLEHTDQELRLERTRPNGQVIEVRRNAVPDGGFVLIYGDITERKRSEAEIRAARDAAEAAYRDLKTAQASLIQAQKMAALGQLTAGIAHEIKNPLNFVNNFAGLSIELLDELKGTAAPAIEALDDDKRAEIDDTIEMLTGNLEKIAEHGRRADGIVKSMLEHSRGVTSERRKVDLNNLVEEALNLTYHGARAQDQNFNITLERDYAKDLGGIDIVPQEVNRVFINLIGNGFYAAAKRQRDDGGSGFRPTLTIITRAVGEAVEVRIRDNGIGIPAEIKDKLFQPFFTTKPTGEGTGLGLSISYDIVTQQHGGTIEVESEVGEFTEFTVRIPRSYRATSEAAS